MKELRCERSCDGSSTASDDGRSFTPQRWSTPLSSYHRFGPRLVAAEGEARWHAPGPEGEFSYLEFHSDRIDSNASP